MSRDEDAGPWDVAGPADGTTLVLGEAGHDPVCRRLAGSRPRAAAVRLTTSEASCCADTADEYEAGVYDDLEYPDAGLAVSEAIANLDHGDALLESGELVVCVDGLPEPTDADRRQQLFQFLHAVTRRVTSEGRCHAHLGVDPDAELAAVVAPLFADVVETDADTASP